MRHGLSRKKRKKRKKMKDSMPKKHEPKKIWTHEGPRKKGIYTTI